VGAGAARADADCCSSVGTGAAGAVVDGEVGPLLAMPIMKNSATMPPTTHGHLRRGVLVGGEVDGT
jgi:hypothetical protein